MSLQSQAAEVVGTADFREFWPIEIRKALVRAANTDGEFPPYAAREAGWALKAAREIEYRMSRDIDTGEALLSQADKRRLAVSR